MLIVSDHRRKAGPSSPGPLFEWLSPTSGPFDSKYYGPVSFTLRELCAGHVDPLNSRYSTTLRYRIAPFSPRPSVAFHQTRNPKLKNTLVGRKSYARRRHAMLAGARVTLRDFPRATSSTTFSASVCKPSKRHCSTRGAHRASSRLGHLVLRLSRASRISARGELTLPRHPLRVHPRTRCWQEDRSVRGGNEAWKWGTRTQAKTSSRSRWFEIRSRTVILLSIMDRIVSFLDKLRRENGDVKFFFFTIRIACKNILKYRQNFVLNLFIDPYIPCLYLSPDSSDSSDSSNSFSDTLLERTI